MSSKSVSFQKGNLMAPVSSVRRELGSQPQLAAEQGSGYAGFFVEVSSGSAG